MRRYSCSYCEGDYEPLGEWVDAEEALSAIAQRDARIAELEAAIDKLAAGKGRYHTEANYLALIAVRNKSLHK